MWTPAFPIISCHLAQVTSLCHSFLICNLKIKFQIRMETIDMFGTPLSFQNITCHFYCIFPITIYAPYPLPPPPTAINTLLSMSMSSFFFARSLHPPKLPPESCQTVLYLWVCLYFVCYLSLFIRFHIWVQSSGTCHSLTGLFYSA